MLRAIKTLLAPIQRRVMNMVVRAVVDATREDKALQKLKLTLLKDEVINDVEMVGHYGFISRALDGAEAAVLFLNGERSHGIVIGTEDRRYRLKTLDRGEVALYTDEGDYIHFKRGRNIEVLAGTKVLVTAPEVEIVASTKVLCTTPLVEMSANCLIKGALTVDGAVLGNTSVTSPLLVQTGPSAVADVGAKVNEIKTQYNSHTHSENGDGGGTTDPTGNQVS